MDEEGQDLQSESEWGGEEEEDSSDTESSCAGKGNHPQSGLRGRRRVAPPVDCTPDFPVGLDATTQSLDAVPGECVVPAEKISKDSLKVKSCSHLS
jgi:hypothetical protein